MVQAFVANSGHPEPVSGRPFTWRDEADLGWFFSTGASTFERSTFGSLVERLEQFAEDDTGQRVKAPADKEAEVWRFRQLQAYRKATTIPQELADAIRELINWDDVDPSLTARPKSSASRNSDPGYTPDHAALMRFAAVSRRLSRIQGSSRRALGLYFGLEGARWVGIRAGQVMVLFAETNAGRKLLERFGQGDDGTPVERVAAIWARNSGAKNLDCSGLLRHAETQAYTLLATAKAAYSEAR